MPSPTPPHPAWTSQASVLRCDYPGASAKVEPGACLHKIEIARRVLIVGQGRSGNKTSLIFALASSVACDGVEPKLRIFGSTSLTPVIGAPSANENFRSIVCVAGRVESVFFLKVIVACILRSGMSASAFTATVAGLLGIGGIVDQTVDPILTTGFPALTEAISTAARAVPGASDLLLSAASLAGSDAFCAIG